MKTSIKTSCLTLFVLLNLVAVECFAADVRDQPRKDGILLVAFGSSEKTAQVSFDTIERMVKRAYSGIPVRWAYTSHVIREKLAKQGTFLDSPETALAKMQDEAFTHVAVQSLHTIGGAEFHDLYRTVDAFERMGGFRKLILGYPLMTTQEDMEKVVAAVRASIPEERSKEDAVLLMGHGTHHPSNALYCSFDVSTATCRSQYFRWNG
ncbi:sirohydrochlorin cobaltochelatase [Prosthecochloris marina]|uniref:sirohydrochlorin cobaltochelatase n=1 Tax=Prosthecochloris marina TaxID=2017681 RepID=UPI00195C59D1|nr:sirohydrochlorin cobaltochelatase [Prosthecochloris marina]